MDAKDEKFMKNLAEFNNVMPPRGNGWAKKPTGWVQKLPNKLCENPDTIREIVQGFNRLNSLSLETGIRAKGYIEEPKQEKIGKLLEGEEEWQEEEWQEEWQEEEWQEEEKEQEEQ